MTKKEAILIMNSGFKISHILLDNSQYLIIKDTIIFTNDNQELSQNAFIDLFDKDVIYTEKQVNEIIKNVYEDYATIRRYLVDYKILSRTTDCKQYWIEKSDKI